MQFIRKGYLLILRAVTGNSEVYLCWFACLQAELEGVQSACEKAESRAAVLAKQVTNLESQLTESQENIQEETRQKLAALSRQRQAEDEMANLKEQLEEEEESQKQLESKISSLTVQVCCVTLLIAVG